MKRPVWIDTDCGVDDAMALLCACALKDIEIVGVSAGVGTTSQENTFRNTRNVLALAGRKDIPVYPGSKTAWIEPYMPAPAFHGEDGLGGAVIPESDAPVETEYAWDAFYKAAKKYEGELTVVTVGALTDLATAIVKYPYLPKYIKEVDIMGGAIDGGNTTMASEANIRRDPHAAQCLFKSGIPVVMFGLDVTEQVRLTPADREEIFRKNTAVTRLMEESIQIPLSTNLKQGLDTYTLHDVCPVLYLSKPELFEGKKAAVYVETQSPLTMGKTISDVYALTDDKFPDKNTLVMLKADREKAVSFFKELMLSYE